MSFTNFQQAPNYQYSRVAGQYTIHVSMPPQRFNGEVIYSPTIKVLPPPKALTSVEDDGTISCPIFAFQDTDLNAIFDILHQILINLTNLPPNQGINIDQYYNILLIQDRTKFSELSDAEQEQFVRQKIPMFNYYQAA